jgi:AraC-like DNA-binding protein
VLAYTAQHYNEPISIAEISRAAFLEAGYFCRFFKKHMGSTFLEYQNELRQGIWPLKQPEIPRCLPL